MEGCIYALLRMVRSALSLLILFSSCKALTLGDAMEGCLSDPEKITLKLRVNWGPASAQQLTKALVDSDANNMHSAHYVDEALEQSDVCRPFDEAPREPIAGTSTETMFNGKSHVDFLFARNFIASRAIDVFSKCDRTPLRVHIPLIPACSENSRATSSSVLSPGSLGRVAQ